MFFRCREVALETLQTAPKWIAAAYKAGTHDKFLIDQSAGTSGASPAKRARKAPAKKAKRGG